MSLFSELKRRSVIRVAAAYAVVAWLVLQIVDIVVDVAEAPAWVAKVILGLLMVGFFLSLILSWLFDVTPEGIRRDQGAGDQPALRAARLDKLTIVAATAVVALLAWQMIRDSGSELDPVVSSADRQSISETTVESAPSQDASIAVLPFADLSPSQDQSYFSDGISEEIINALSSISSLGVASRTSSFAFRNQDEKSIPQIGAALRVRHVLEGSVRSVGDRIRITAQLVDANTDKQLWSQTYDKVLSAETVFAIQDEIAVAIVDALVNSIGLEASALEQLNTRADTEDLTAYQRFLRGRQRFRVRSVSNIPGTIDLFQQAVELDPEFARAWAGLAAVAVVAPSWGISDGEDYVALAERAARRAIELDDSLALPYAVLGNLQGDGVLPIRYAEDLGYLEQALEREPDNTTALLWRGITAIQVGKFEQAVVDLDRCRDLDPGYQNCVVWGGLARLYAGDYEGAMESYDLQAATRSSSQAQQFALAILHKEDELTALLALAWALESFDAPFNPDLVYRAFKDPEFDTAAEYAAFSEYRVELTGESPDMSAPGSLLPMMFRRYSELVPDQNNMYWWHPSFPELRRSPEFKRIIRELGIYTYWQQAGFPPQCRAVGDDDFECDEVSAETS
ncbi:MAG: hypothetical protein AAF578_02685 [Pseudomonadota bacterium]